MKRPVTIVLIICFILIAYFFFHTNQLKEQLSTSKEEVKTLEKQLEELQQGYINTDAMKVASDFIYSYYKYESVPKEENVTPYVTANAKEKMSFEEPSELEIEGDEKVISDVEELKMYLGQSTDTRQELFATFENAITYEGVKSKSPSYLSLDMVKINGKWKVDNIEFKQF